MKKLLTLCFLFPLFLLANDGAYFINGNMLVPIEETDISVKKEILTIERISETHAKIKVYYEFYNPSASKTLLVGFEADSPSGDVNPTPIDGKHPYMSDFTVKVNNASIPYKVAMVDENLKKGSYFKNNKITKLTPDEISERSYGEYAEYYYVYHFDAVFRKGLNIVEHTYTVRLSGSVVHDFSLHYVLTAANRWANKQIDDFTLIIDMGKSTSFHVENKPFGTDPKWTIEGSGTMRKGKISPYYNIEQEDGGMTQTTKFDINNAKVVFKQKNFSPQGELMIYSPSRYVFDASTMDLSGTEPILDILFPEAADDFSRKVLYNLPFARRGYVFKSDELKKYYSRQTWYTPDPQYRATLESLTADEREWIKMWDNALIKQ